jgi:predicted SprT family Zn-dependent metalloprotease
MMANNGNNYVEQLQNLYFEAADILEEIGIDFDTEWVDRIEVSARLKRCLGQAIKNDSVYADDDHSYLKFNKTYLDTYGVFSDEVMNTMIHEMLHVYCTAHGKYCGHTGLWKELADKVSRETKYKITRLADRNQLSEYTQRIATKSKYQIYCPHCQKVVATRKSRCKLIDHISHYHCGKCHGDLEVREAF